MKEIQVNGIKLSNDLPIILIAGPCQIESEDHALSVAGEIAEICRRLEINFIYKSSFDKANRTSISTRRGLGFEASCNVFSAIKKHIGCPVLTDIHEPPQAAIVADYVDVLQIPALLSRQTDLIVAAAKTGKCINIKKGQFMSPYDIKHAIEKCIASNNGQVMVTERGTSFGYNTLINDMRGIQIMKETTFPVVFDATHSVQQPAGLGSASGGQREFIEVLARAATAVGVSGLFIETHQDPDLAPSDGQCMLPLRFLEDFLVRIQEIDCVTKKYSYLFIK